MKSVDCGTNGYTNHITVNLIIIIMIMITGSGKLVGNSGVLM